MDNFVPSYPPQERLESVDDHEEAPEPSEMTWTLSQLIRKTRKMDQQATAPKGIEQNEPIPVPTSTPARIQREFTHASDPQPQPGQDQTFETYCEISSSQSLKPMVARLESRNNKLKEKLQEYTILDRHIKIENELMKVRITHFLSKIERLK
jgi:hypothetical protein